MSVKAYGTYAADRMFEPILISRRAPGPHDVQIAIAFCGVCHSDLHAARGEWPGIRYPCVPGHEIVGHVTAVGDHVSRFKVGDTVGVGCLVGSCRTCGNCDDGFEQYCPANVLTYNSPTADEPGYTLGGYAQSITVDDHFVVKVTHPEDRLAGVAPLLCAGITTYSPLKHWGAGPGRKVGVVGIGGLGHMGIKIAHAMGAATVAFTSSESKRRDILSLGADDVIVTGNEEEMAKHRNSFDIILDTVGASHNLDTYLAMLRRDGTLVLLGAADAPHPSPTVHYLMAGRRSIAGSAIGGLPETQEMLDFCARHGIVSDVETIPAHKIDEAFERMQKSDVKYRFVIDAASMD
jgi:uncharacterized zinc-type alcohol dehydrogenase-like protein